MLQWWANSDQHRYISGQDKKDAKNRDAAEKAAAEKGPKEAKDVSICMNSDYTILK